MNHVKAPKHYKNGKMKNISYWKHNNTS